MPRQRGPGSGMRAASRFLVAMDQVHRQIDDSHGRQLPSGRAGRRALASWSYSGIDGPLSVSLSLSLPCS